VFVDFADNADFSVCPRTFFPPSEINFVIVSKCYKLYAKDFTIVNFNEGKKVLMFCLSNLYYYNI